MIIEIFLLTWADGVVKQHGQREQATTRQVEWAT